MISNSTQLNSLGTISWQRNLVGSMSINSWNSLASNQSAELYWVVRMDPPVRRLNHFLILLFSTRHLDHSISCFDCVANHLIIRSGLLPPKPPQPIQPLNNFVQDISNRLHNNLVIKPIAAATKLFNSKAPPVPIAANINTLQAKSI